MRHILARIGHKTRDLFAAAVRGWRRWNALQDEAASSLFQRSVDPLNGGTRHASHNGLARYF